MSKTHFRRLTPDEFDALGGENAYQKAALFGGVIVARPSGDYVLDVSGGDSPELPGIFLASDLSGLHASTYPAVAEAEWEREVPVDPEKPRGPTYVERGRSKMNAVPEGATITASDLSPHEWA